MFGEMAAVDGAAACDRFTAPRSAPCDMPDATLIARIAIGDRLAMHALFVRHKTRVYRFILRLVGDAASADDLTSEVFLAVWRAQEARHPARRARREVRGGLERTSAADNVPCRRGHRVP